MIGAKNSSNIYLESLQCHYILNNTDYSNLIYQKNFANIILKIVAVIIPFIPAVILTQILHKNLNIFLIFFYRNKF